MQIMLHFSINKAPRVIVTLGFVLVLFVACSNGTALRRDERGLRETFHNMKDKAKTYFQSFGWLPSFNPETFRDAKDSIVRKATRLFQRFYGLPETGEVDAATQVLMETPRCGVADNTQVVDFEDEGDDSDITIQARKKRYVIQKSVLLGQKWKTRDLKYRVNKYSQKIEASVIDGALRKAFYEWQKVSPFTITHKEEGPVHIDIKFENGDGKGKALAYAYGPGPGIGGDMRFDEYEDWTVRTAEGQSLYMVALHEIGHVFGLDHSNVKGAIMNPYYSGYVRGKSLMPDDIAAIQSIYGPPNARPTVPPPKAVSDPSGKARAGKLASVYGNNVCDIREGVKVIDGVTITADKRVYAFKGANYFELKQESVNSDLRPQPISQGWVGLPDSIDTVFTGPEGNTFFFKGDQYWKFRNRQMSAGYPKQISQGFPGVPNNVDAVFVYNPNKRIYFIKGDQYWRFEPGTERRVADGYPKSLREWKKLPQHIDAAVLWRDGRTYFFSGKDYYKFNDFTFAVEDGYPKSIASWWFACEPSVPANANDNGVLSATDEAI